MKTTRTALTAALLLLPILPITPALAEGEVVRVDAVTPDELAQTGNKRTVTIEGQFLPTSDLFAPGRPTVSVSGSDVGVTYKGHDATMVSVDLAVAVDAAPGLRDVTVEQEGISHTCTDCVRIGPVMSSVAPSSISTDGSSDVEVSVHGLGFRSGAVVHLTRGDVGFDAAESFTVAPTVDDVGDFEVRTRLEPETLAGQPRGPWDVMITNADGGQDTIAGAVELDGADPTITGSTTPVGLGGPTERTVTITGTGLSRASTVSFTPDGLDQAGPVEWVSSQELHIPVTVSATEPGTFSAEIVDASGTSATCDACVEVVEPATITALSPAQVGQGAESFAVTANGDRFPSDISETDIVFGNEGVVVQTIDRAAADRLDLLVDVASDADPGEFDVTVEDPNNGGVSVCENCLEVAPAPVPTRVDPGRVQQGARQTVTVRGSGFVTRTRVDLGPGIDIASKRTLSGTAVQLDVLVADNASTGSRRVSLTNPDGGVGGCVCVRVDPADPPPSPPAGDPPSESTTRSAALEGAATSVTTPSGRGYWIFDPEGGVHTFGDARYFGSVPGLRAAGIEIGAVHFTDFAVAPDGDGYWLLDEVGGVHAFGDARYFGSVPALRAAGLEIGAAHFTDFAVAPSGDGYWLLDEAGGVHAFGDARYFGSVPALRAAGVDIPAVQFVGLAATPRGDGYWLLDEVGGVHAFGDARYFGSVPALRAAGHAIGPVQAQIIDATPNGAGYRIFDQAGGVFTFGNASFAGSLPERRGG